MTEAELTNMTHQFTMAISRAVAKHRKENVVVPSADEYISVLHNAVDTVAEMLAMPKRGPGRPRKQRVQVDQPLPAYVGPMDD